MAEPTYQQLLTEALEIGRVDGRFAAAFETSSEVGARCLGRSPADFARLLWGGDRGPVPTGLEVNGQLWYATGYAEGLAEGLAQQAAERTSAAKGRTPVRPA